MAAQKLRAAFSGAWASVVRLFADKLWAFTLPLLAMWFISGVGRGGARPVRNTC